MPDLGIAALLQCFPWVHWRFGFGVVCVTTTQINRLRFSPPSRLHLSAL